MTKFYIGLALFLAVLWKLISEDIGIFLVFCFPLAILTFSCFMSGLLQIGDIKDEITAITKLDLRK